ncbi:MAG: MFS transporter, partial [Actinomycetota bacterium]|nr:MFS transporter [Actinomycetota bacterium]
SGVVNTAFMMGGALGLAILASLAASRTDNLLASGEMPLAALNGGYHAAFLIGAVFAVAAALVAVAFLRPASAPTQVHADAAASAEPAHAGAAGHN